MERDTPLGASRPGKGQRAWDCRRSQVLSLTLALDTRHDLEDGADCNRVHSGMLIPRRLVEGPAGLERSVEITGKLTDDVDILPE